MSFESCIGRHVFEGHMDQETTDDVLSRFRDDVMRGTPRPQARANAQARMEEAARVTRAKKALDVAARDGLVKYLQDFRDVYGRPDAIEAGKAVYEDFGWSGHPSVRFLRESLFTMSVAKAAEALDHFRRATLLRNLSVLGRRQNKAQIGDLTKAMFGETGISPELQRFAASLKDAANDLRLMHNQYSGETIPFLQTWDGPQVWEEDAIHNAGGFANDPARAREYAWNKLDPLFDWAKMRDPVTQEVFGTPPGDNYRREIFDHIIDSMITNGRANRQPVARKVGMAGGPNRADHRYIVFKNAEAKMEAMREFGVTDTLAQYLRYFDSMAGEIALMKTFGANVTGNIEWMKQVIMQEADKRAGVGMRGGVEVPNLLPSYRPKNVQKKAQFAGKMIDGFYHQYRGDGIAPSNNALMGTVLQADAYSSLLGSAVVLHTTSNWAIQTQARMLAGMPWASVIPHIIARGFGAASERELLLAGLHMQDGAQAAEGAAKNLSRMQKLAKWAQWWPDRTTQLSGLVGMVGANQRTFVFDRMGHIADMKRFDWNALPRSVRDKFAGYGLREPDWRLIQKSQNYIPSIGTAPWQRAEEIRAVAREDPQAVLDIFGQEDPHARDLDFRARYQGVSPDGQKLADRLAFDTAWKLQASTLGEMEVAVPKHLQRTRAWLYAHGMIYDRSTFWSSMMNSPLFAKSFIASFTYTAVRGVYREIVRNPVAGIAMLAGYFIALGILGTVAYSVKQVASGYDIPPLDPRTRRGLMTYYHGLLTGGSFGIIDIVMQDWTSYGRGLAETLMGPVAGAVLAPLSMAQMLVERELQEKPLREPVGTTLGKAVLRNSRGLVPILPSHWATRAAFDRIVMDGMQHLIDPRANWEDKQRNNRLIRERGQDMWWRHGEWLPHRMPGFSDSGPRLPIFGGRARY